MRVNRIIGVLFEPPNRFAYDVVFYSLNLLLLYYAAVYREWYWNLLCFGAGVCSWILFEYLIHRYIFHFKTKNIILRKAVYAVHGVHHGNTKDKNRFYVPLIPSLAITFLILWLFQQLLHSSVYSFMVGAIFMHQIYNYIHLAIHNEGELKSKYLLAMREHHFRHHYFDGDRCFGVTSKFFDRVFKST